MSFFGTTFAKFNPIRDGLYKLFIDYYGDANFTKLEHDSEFSTYYCKISCGLINVHKYLIIKVKADFFTLNTVKKLSELQWESFQTRLLEQNYRLPIHVYTENKRNELMNYIITLTERGENAYLYETSYTTTLSQSDSNNQIESVPINVLLLPKGKTGFDYQQKGTLLVALNTFHTVVIWK
jgi:carbonic anhydrase